MKGGGNMNIDHLEECDVGEFMGIVSVLTVRGRGFAWHCISFAGCRVHLGYMSP
jgi:hypothetical protein